LAQSTKKKQKIIKKSSFGQSQKHILQHPVFWAVYIVSLEYVASEIVIFQLL
jgi:hypothetical protein